MKKHILLTLILTISTTINAKVLITGIEKNAINAIHAPPMTDKVFINGSALSSGDYSFSVEEINLMKHSLSENEVIDIHTQTKAFGLGDPYLKLLKRKRNKSEIESLIARLNEDINFYLEKIQPFQDEINQLEEKIERLSED